jgi:hypothetical protein
MAVNYVTGGNPGSVVVGAFKGDGRADLAIGVGKSGLSVLLDVASTPDLGVAKTHGVWREANGEELHGGMPHPSAVAVPIGWIT